MNVIDKAVLIANQMADNAMSVDVVKANKLVNAFVNELSASNVLADQEIVLPGLISDANVRIDLEQRMNAAWVQVEVASITGDDVMVGHWMTKHAGLQNELSYLMESV